MPPRLSVVVPFYNVADYIGDCLDSIARQSYRDFEAILVDDGSADDSATIAKEWCRRDERFRIVAQDNQGLGPARNTGVRAAQGEYLAFVDSDDLVTRHGFETLIGTLDQTGSCFAGGNARRFNNSSGVRSSWIHRIPFARDRIATHVIETPDLVLDRMVWNKVYRRSFWDEHDYQFPAIRYEDYPVTLKAHLDAGTVDALAVPVYYWRERESGESITQQRFQFANLADRVRSAEWVMDLVESGVPEVRRRVHAHLAEIDMLTLLNAFESVPIGQEEELVQLARRLLDRLDAAALLKPHRYDRLQHEALRVADVDLLRRLAEYRLNGGLRGGARALPRPGRPWQFEQDYPGVRDESVSVPRELYSLPIKAMSLATTVRHVRWDAGVLVVQGTAEIRHLQLRPSSSLRVSLVIAGSEHPLGVRRFLTTDSHGDQTLVGFEVRLGERLLRRLAGIGGAHFLVRLRSGVLRRSGKLRGPMPGSPTWPPGHWVRETDWIQPGRGKDGSFVLRRMVDPCRLTRAELTRAEPTGAEQSRAEPIRAEPTGVDLTRAQHAGVERTGAEQVREVLRLYGKLPADLPDAQLRLSRTLTGHHRALPIQVTGDGRDFTVDVPIGTVIDETEPDDPFSQRTTWAVELISPDENRSLLLWTAPPKAVNWVVDGRQVTLTRSVGNYVNLHEAPARLAADQAVAQTITQTITQAVTQAADRTVNEGPARGPDKAADEGGQLVVGGPVTDDGVAQAFTWRRHFENSDDHVDVPCRRTVAHGRWTAGVELADLIPTHRTRHLGTADPLAALANWILFAIAADGSSYAVQCEPFLAGRLPIEVEQDGCVAALRPRAGTLHVEVR